MFRTKLLAGILLVLAVLVAQVGSVAAAPQTQETTPLTGTVKTITTQTDSSGGTTVVVTFLDDQGVTQTVRLTLEAAVGLNLINKTTLEVNGSLIGQPITIDPTVVLPEEEPAEEAVHPIAAILADFFDEEVGVIDGYHEDGFGFGVIAQALWMSENINGDASAAGLILEAKQSGDYSAFQLPDGSSPTNWGQFKKAILQKDKKNLGIIVSGHAENGLEDPATEQDHGNGKEKDKDKGKGKDKDKKNNKP